VKCSSHVAVDGRVLIVTTTLDEREPPLTEAHTSIEPSSSVTEYCDDSSDILGPIGEIHTHEKERLLDNIKGRERHLFEVLMLSGC
jgi:hypothetical protein